MMDLIGFWAAVTTVVLPVLFIFAWLCEVFVNHEVYVVTDGRCRFEPVTNWWNSKIWRPAERESNEILVVLAGVLSIIFSLSILLGSTVESCEKGVSYISAFAGICVEMTPVFSWVGVVMLIILVQRMLLRPMLKKMYAIKLKVDKL